MQEPSSRLMKTIKVIDSISEWSGRITAILVIPMIVGLVYEVIARYAFNAPTIWAYDFTYMIYGGHFMLGAAYTLLKGGHIRTDILYQKWYPLWQGRIDFTLYLFLFFPGMIFFFLSGMDEAVHAWVILEKSEATAWRPAIYPFKTVIPVGAFLILVQGVSELLKSYFAARRGRWL